MYVILGEKYRPKNVDSIRLDLILYYIATFLLLEV